MTPVVRFKGGQVCTDSGELKVGDVWVQEGKIIDPLGLFYRERKPPDCVIDCRDLIVAPGFIDMQINGKYLGGILARTGWGEISGPAGRGDND